MPFGIPRFDRSQLPPDMWSSKLVPLLELFDVLGRRWSLRIVWELHEGPATFRELQRRADGVSSSVLADRLRDLRTAGVVAHERGEGYRLTEVGLGLAARIIDIYHWLDQCEDWPSRPA